MNLWLSSYFFFKTQFLEDTFVSFLFFSEDIFEGYKGNVKGCGWCSWKGERILRSHQEQTMKSSEDWNLIPLEWGVPQSDTALKNMNLGLCGRWVWKQRYLGRCWDPESRGSCGLYQRNGREMGIKDGLNLEDVIYSMMTIVNNTVLHIWQLLRE